MGDGAGEGARYRAFISYSHVDRTFGRRLHRRLERYALPRRLVGRLTVNGPAPARVSPVFRDRDELPAAGDLTAEVRAALAVSGALVVVCSPAAAASPWVAREIELFRELHPGRPVLAALAVGEPAAAFPPALWRVNGTIVEPLAADFRREGDGSRLALLKLVAGVLGLGLDELVQRDVQRRLRGVTAVTAGAVSLALVMSGLTTYALLQRAEAQRQRGEAEALVEFMLTDLRDRLKGVGRLDVLTAVNERTLAYYAGRDVERLPAASQMRYARILQAMGEDDLARGKAAEALGKFKTAEGITARLFEDQPRAPGRAWAQGQSEYWLGYHRYHSAYLRRSAGSHAERHNDRATIAAHWLRYRTIARQLAAMAPEDPKSQRELAFAEGNLCTLELQPPADATAARRHCEEALAQMKAVARLAAEEAGIAADVMNRHAWLADAYAAGGDWSGARKERLEQERLLNILRRDEPLNTNLKLSWVALQRGLAQAEIRLDRDASAEARMLAARHELSVLVNLDPENQDWKRRKAKIEADLHFFENMKVETRNVRSVLN